MNDNFEIPEEVKIFLVEAYENMDKVEQDLISLESKSNDIELLNRIFRAIHTTKGNSGFLGFSCLESVCHKGEGVLDRLRAGKLKVSPDLTSVLLELIDYVRGVLTSIEHSGQEKVLDPSALLGRLAKF